MNAELAAEVSCSSCRRSTRSADRVCVACRQASPLLTRPAVVGKLPIVKARVVMARGVVAAVIRSDGVALHTCGRQMVVCSICRNFYCNAPGHAAHDCEVP